MRPDLSRSEPSYPASFAPSDQTILDAVLRQTRQSDAPSAAASHPAPRPNKVWTLPGFAAGCRLSTSFGELPIEALRLRDRVKTRSGAYRQVEWIDEIRLDADFMARHPEALPIQIRTRTLGPCSPVRDIVLSPGQMIFASDVFGGNMMGAASELEGLPGVSRLPRSEMTYFMFHCGQQEAVCVDGAWFLVSP
ncbi:Hint domain-containing protein [Sedimentitalea sp. JM2-8]|uniref:Hint domain-containing protein n=1 Tax=Sedimentitalea xiamensis TaxID=3050037 RepID=A0ABT7FJZ3_9RHOB|nr:Hint domain-containing protein [Sedimentitalea xiamensis]MDK3075459.1 Hint domain-containing protein [Sedimentitalea xiamensis]